MTRYIFVTGGVVSSLGKGITAASIGRLLKAHGLSVTIVKCDPYINVDAGTMTPFQHGEVFVTEDGAETDLDLGYYERFLGIDTARANNMTAGQIYQTVIAREREGNYLGQTVQVIPHITDEIKRRFVKAAEGFDIAIIEIGGTVGDIESLPFLEAARQMRPDRTRNDVLYLHVTLVPYLTASDELKTKPTQHSVNKLREIGIDPDIIVCRAEKPLARDIKNKIALFTSVPKEAVIDAPDSPSIYDVPFILKKQGLDEQIMMLLRLRSDRWDFDEWTDFVQRLKRAETSRPVRIAIAGKYTKLKDSYKSLVEAIQHGAIANGVKAELDYVDVEEKDFKTRLARANGLIVPGGFGDRGIEGKIEAIRYARENRLPFLGICLGMQCATIEFARNVLGLRAAHSSEFNAKTPHPVVDLMLAQKGVRDKGGTMRLGAWPCHIRSATLAHKVYGAADISERHRHRYEFNAKYAPRYAKKGFIVSGLNGKLKLPEIIEIKDHPWFIGVQFHPEFKSRPLLPHPLFFSFVAAAGTNAQQRG
ncbi:MAG: CTP synthase [Elusimicrobia bacterium RIFOXYA2_FULL_58_8]|nr:MAG: CTP synthase [Elusimicrobia bacterium RIFOXYA12_FULL_57_11]OGS14903.1 MAG: CTP synthase [Elusimicrobia bacterium RIFOXYA2_FULL_58_8]